MSCETCNHEEHAVGECKNCNCGQSEICHPRPGYGYLTQDTHGGAVPRASGGRRVGFDRNVDDEE